MCVCVGGGWVGGRPSVDIWAPLRLPTSIYVLWAGGREGISAVLEPVLIGFLPPVSTPWWSKQSQYLKLNYINV